MKNIKIGFILLGLLSLGSCNNQEEISPVRGKVKFETMVLHGKTVKKFWITLS